MKGSLTNKKGEVDVKSVEALPRDDLRQWIFDRLHGEDLMIPVGTRMDDMPSFLFAILYPKLKRPTRAELEDIISEFLKDLAYNPESEWLGESGNELMMLVDPVLVRSYRREQAIDVFLHIANSSRFQSQSGSNIHFRALQSLVTLRHRASAGFWRHQYEVGGERYASVVVEGLALVDVAAPFSWLTEAEWNGAIEYAIINTLPSLLEDYGTAKVASVIEQTLPHLSGSGRQTLLDYCEEEGITLLETTPLRGRQKDNDNSGVVNRISDRDQTSATLVELLQRRASEHPDRDAYIFLTDGETDEVKLTYGRLDRQARAIAASLQSLNAVGERVLLIFPPGIEYIAGFLGCLYAGAVAVPAYPPRFNHNPQGLEAIITDAQATIALTASQILPRLTPLAYENSALNSLRWLTIESISADLVDEWRLPAIDADSLAFLQYTSGSTRRPKGVMISHKNLLHNERLIQQAFRQSEQSIVINWLPLYHDMGLIGGVLQPLYLGAKAILMSPMAFLTRPHRWLQAISTYRATTSGGPNFAYDLCVNKITPEQRATLDLRGWEIAFNGSEPVRAQTLERFVSAFEPCGFRREAFYPCYGLAEATLFVSGGQLDKGSTVKSVSARALANNRAVAASSGDEGQTLVGCGALPHQNKVVIVDPQQLSSRLAGQVGEIWLSGPSVTRGYWNDPEDSNRTFRAFLSNSGEGPFLRTGDLGFIENGELFVTGRLKDLIIINGVNHYPHDIELTAELSHESLRPGCNAAFPIDVSGQERLVVVQEIRGPFEANTGQVISTIRQAILEAHQIHAYAVALIRRGTIPKTSSGKIQRHACRKGYLNGDLQIIDAYTEPDVAGAHQESPLSLSTYAAQEIEALLINLIAAKLRIDPSRISASTPIARYGFDSLAAVELVHAVETTLGIVMPVTTFLPNPDSPTIGDIAARAMAQMDEDSPGTSIKLKGHYKTGEAYPLSYGQQAIWFLQQIDSTSTAYIIASAIRIVSELDVLALRQSLQALIDRHPMLGATITTQQGEPLQQTRQNLQLRLSEEDASEWSSASLNNRLTELANQPFDLEGGCLCRAYLFARPPREHVFLLVLHHLIADFWSLELLINELSLMYSAKIRGESPRLPPLNAQYIDYVRWQTDMLGGREGERLWTYWQNQLQGDLPPLDLPRDKPRPPVQSFRGSSESLQLNEELTRSLKDLARSAGTTLYVVLMATFYVLLHRYTGQEQLIVGSPTSGRGRAGFADLIGYFVNPIPIKVDFSYVSRFNDLLNLIRVTIMGALEHQEYPFSLLVGRLQPVRDPGRSPLFQVMFVLQKAGERQELAALALGEPGVRIKLHDLELETLALEQRAVQFDLTLMAAEIGRGIILSIHYNIDLFESTTIRRVLANYQKLLESVVAHPDRCIEDLPIISDNERQQVLIEWNETAKPFPATVCLHELFERQSELNPDAIALVWRDQSLTYSELNRRANRLAHFIKTKLVATEQRVAICVERSVDMIVGLLAILKAGAAYLPLDPSHPVYRHVHLLEDAGARLLVTQEKFSANFAGLIDQLIRLDTQAGEIAAHSAQNVISNAEAGNLAYVIYTSGSTGRPKGVSIEHHSAVAMVTWARDEYSQQELSGVLASTSIGFDLSVFEIFVPLSWGGTVVLVDNALELIKERAADQVRLINTVPSAIAELVRAGAISESVQTVNLAGEVLISRLAQDVYSGSAVERVMNLYGPSEGTTYSTYARVERGASQAPSVGRPISNGRVYVLDARMNAVPIGVVGEIYLAGEGLVRGYWENADLTAGSFVPNPLGAQAGSRIYRTGDLGRYRMHGEIEYVGRVDRQVKLRGYRIELGEIEATLNQHKGVHEAVVIARDDEGYKRIVAYFVPAAGEHSNITELQSYLKERLPDYMVPTVYVKLDGLPLTANGKVDRRSLPAPGSGYEDSGIDYTSPRTPVEELLAEIWKEVLRVDRVGIYDNFFDLGGHSILAIQAIARAHDMGIHFTLVQFFQHPTVAKLANLSDQSELDDENWAAGVVDGLQHVLSRQQLEELVEAVSKGLENRTN
jgi:amino acid adenylation domain-containing protein